jgi:glycerophosphoryl diester phosphodiesterase
MAPVQIAHRGFAGVYPENTLAAVRGAAADGAEMVELDVVPTGDGDVVAFHDARLDGGGDSRGVTDGEGVVWERPTSAVTAARVLGTDERVPLLADVVGAVPDGVGLNVELKNPGTGAIRPFEALSAADRRVARERWTPFVDELCAVTDSSDVDVLFSSFCEGALAAVQSRDGDARLAALVGHRDWEAGVEVARRYDVDAVHVPIEQADNEAVTAVADDIGAATNVWTVRDWRDAKRALQAGADGLIADYPGLARYAMR